jgi:NADH:ubiquinone oxidoreductase subunit E
MNIMPNSGPAPARERDDLLAKLKEAQRRYGYVSKEFMSETARSLQIPLSEVYGVTTFYSFLSTRPLGKHVIHICKSIPCYLKHAEMIIDSVSHVIGIRPGETTSDGKFSFELTNCVGACDMAPAMLLNQQVHGHLTPEKIAEILSASK